KYPFVSPIFLAARRRRAAARTLDRPRTPAATATTSCVVVRDVRGSDLELLPAPARAPGLQVRGRGRPCDRDARPRPRLEAGLCGWRERHAYHALFVNGHLAVNLEGVHPAQMGSLDMDAQAAELGIAPGNTYRIDIFQAERHIAGSTFHVETTLQCIDNNVP